jgi:hypothetical protein
MRRLLRLGGGDKKPPASEDDAVSSSSEDLSISGPTSFQVHVMHARLCNSLIEHRSPFSLAH